jgi:hypothetical protein
MIRTVFVATLAGALVSCGQATDTSDATKVDATKGATTAAPGATTTAADGRDPCALVSNPEAVFGRPVTTRIATMPNNTRMCEWRSAEDRICGMVTVLGPGWNDTVDIPRNYAAMVTSLGAFGTTKELAGVGEEARIVDGGMLGAQIAFRTSNAVVNVGAACGDDGQARTALAEKIARAVAENL